MPEPTPIETVPTPAKRPKTLKVVAWLVAIGAFSALASASFRWYANHQPILTNDAQLTGDTDRITIDAPGQVDQILVKAGDSVKTGQLLASLQNPSLATELASAQKDVQAAQQAEQTTQAQVLPPSLTGTMPVIPKTPLPPVAPATATLVPNPQQSSLEKDDADSKSAVDAQKKLVDQAALDLKAAQSDADAAKSKLDAANGPIESLQANLDLAKAQQTKFQGLYNDGIISRKEFQNKQDEVTKDQSALDDAQKAVADASTEVTRTTAAVQAATVANALASKKLDDLTAHYNHVHGVLAALPKTVPGPAQPVIPARPVIVAQKPRIPMPPALGDDYPRMAAPRGLSPMRVDFNQPKHDLAQEKLQGATDRLNSIQSQLNALKLLAPADEMVEAVDIKFGDRIQQTPKVAFTMVRPETYHIVAHIPHSQALRIKQGMFCAVTLSTLPKIVFGGAVNGFLDAGTPNQAATVEIVFHNPPTLLLQQPPGTRAAIEIRPN